MSSLFQGLAADDGAVTFTVGVGAIPGTAAFMRSLAINPVEALGAFPIYASTGQPLASVGAGGLSFDANGRLRVNTIVPVTPVQLPGGILANAAGELIITNSIADLIYQGVALTVAGAISTLGAVITDGAFDSGFDSGFKIGV